MIVIGSWRQSRRQPMEFTRSMFSSAPAHRAVSCFRDGAEAVLDRRVRTGLKHTNW
jgi:hypothetical protein